MTDSQSSSEEFFDAVDSLSGFETLDIPSDAKDDDNLYHSNSDENNTNTAINFDGSNHIKKRKKLLEVRKNIEYDDLEMLKNDKHSLSEVKNQNFNQYPYVVTNYDSLNGQNNCSEEKIDDETPCKENKQLLSLASNLQQLSDIKWHSLNSFHNTSNVNDINMKKFIDICIFQEPDVIASSRLPEENDVKSFPKAPPRRKKCAKYSDELQINKLDLSHDLRSNSSNIKSCDVPIIVMNTGRNDHDIVSDSESYNSEYCLNSKTQNEFSDKKFFTGNTEEINKDSQIPQKELVNDDHESGIMTQLNMVVRTRTNSGRSLDDEEILNQLPVKNLDTGESFPLSEADNTWPSCVNPLSLHIMKLTSELNSINSSDIDKESVNVNSCGIAYRKSSLESNASDISKTKEKKSRITKFLGRTVEKTFTKVKSIAHEVKDLSQKQKDEHMALDLPEETTHTDLGLQIKVKASSSHKNSLDFENLQFAQYLNEFHHGPVWAMKFSICGRLLATAGQDCDLRIWVIKDAFVYFQDMRQRFSVELKISPTPSQESLQSQHSFDELSAVSSESYCAPFITKPFCVYKGHTADVLDVSWSKNYFILSSSMDKTVRLWHISRKECLCSFQHIDFVTAIAFHPKDDRYFLSGSLDGKLRLWNIPDKKVALWNELEGPSKLITAVSFCQSGKIAIVGSYDGRCIFYITDQLKYFTQLNVCSSKKKYVGRKITGIEAMPGEDKILVTTNDSRIRLYDQRDLSLICKYKGRGYINLSSQIRASFSHDGKYIISGSENQCVYIWKTRYEFPKLSSSRRDLNDFWEGVKAHNAVVTAAIFSPKPDVILKQIERDRLRNEKIKSNFSESQSGYVIATADFTGCIKIFSCKAKPKHSSLPASALS